MSRPLAGRRVVVTRAARQSGGLQTMLEQAGAEVLLVPTIETAPPLSYEPLDAALREAAHFAWLIVTSANAVRVLAERLTALGQPANALAHLRCAAVGPATATALADMGLHAEVVPERAVGEALAAALTNQVRGQRVLLARAAAARDVIPKALALAGAHVTVADAYRTVIPAGAVERAQAVFGGAKLPEAALFTSGSTVTHLVDVLREAGLVFPASVACVSIGPVTTDALREAGLRVAAEAESASLAALVTACAELFCGRPNIAQDHL